MPRVLHLYKDVFPPVFGGIEVVLGKLAYHQVQRGWDVSVAVSGPVDEDWAREKKVRVIPVGEWGRCLSNPLTMGFMRVLREEPYDVLHLHLPCPTAVLSTLLAARRDVPWFASYQSDIVRQRFSGMLYQPFQQRFLAQTTRIFVSSPRLLETSPVLQKVQPHCQVVPLGITPSQLSPEHRTAGEAIRQQYGQRPLVLFVGRFRWYKGLPVLLEAIDRVDAELLIIGSGTPAQKFSVDNLLKKMKHPQRIHLLGSVPYLEPYLAAADIFCLPSTHRAEAFGYVLLEAFRAGLPAVTTELGTGTSYVNLDGVTGRVVTAGDSQALVNGLQDLLEDPDRRRAMGAAARQRVEEEFYLEKMVASITNAYEHNLLTDPTKHRLGVEG